MALEDVTVRGMLGRHKCTGADCYANTDLCKFESSPDLCDMVPFTHIGHIHHWTIESRQTLKLDAMSSNINEVIRPVLNFIYIFLR